MAVKICAGSSCITCRSYSDTPESVSKEIERDAKAGKMFYCCRSGGGCIVISKITHIEAAIYLPPREDEDHQEDPRKEKRKRKAARR